MSTEVRPQPLDRPVRVLLLVKGLGLGGAESLLVGQATTASPGVEFSVAFIRSDKTHFVRRLQRSGVEVVALGSGRWDSLWPIALARHLRLACPDIVHAHSPLPAAVARVLVQARRFGRSATATTVYTEHNRWSAYRVPTRLVNGLTMALDSQVWAVSDEARSSVRPRWLRSRVVTLHHGIDSAAVRAAAALPTQLPAGPADPASFTFVHVANRRPEKAHDVLLAAFGLASAEDGDLRLWLVGQGLDDPGFAAGLDRHPARDRIYVLGYRSDAAALIAAADAMVLSSDHEGLPVAVMEAFALGRPVISTRVGGVPEAVRHEREGLLVPRRDPTALAAAMLRLHRDPGLCAVLGAGALARADVFDAGRAHRAQAEVYRRVGSRS